VSVEIRPAGPGDASDVFRLVRELAVYEKLLDQMVATEEALAAALFGPHPRVFCDLAIRDERAVGFAVWFYTYSTFLGRHGIFLEDLFVEPERRGEGIGKALLKALAARCVREGLGRLEWAVLDWNQPSIDFYVSQGARMLDDWRMCRLTGQDLAALGTGENRSG